MNDSPRNPDESGSDDLDARLRSLIGAARDAAPPAPQIEFDPTVVPLRRRDDRRFGGRGRLLTGLAAVGTAAAVMAAVVVMDDDSTERLQPAPPATAADSVTTVPDSVPDSVPDPSPSSTVPNSLPTGSWEAYAVGPDGLVAIPAAGGYQPRIPESFVSVAAGPDDNVYVQRFSGPAPSGTDAWDQQDTEIIRWNMNLLEFDPVDVPHVDGTWLRLHDAGTLAGDEVILYEEMQTPNPTGPDAGRLLLWHVDSGELTVVDDDFGGWERWSNLFQVADNGLVVGETTAEVTTSPTIYRVLESAPDVTPESLGLQASYSECGFECPRHLTVDPTGTVFAYLWRGAVSWTDGVGVHWTELTASGDISRATQVMVTSDAAAVVAAPSDTPTADSDTSVRVLTLDGRDVEVPGTAVSLYSDVPVPTVTNDLDPSDVDGSLVVGQNAATGDDLRRLPEDRSGTGLEMSCPSPQSKTWEYDAGFGSTESGVAASVQLSMAIAAVNSEFLLTGRAGELPTSGWTMIVDGSNRWFVLPNSEGNWWAVVSVAGKPWSDSWRAYDAWFCNEGPVPSPDDPFVPTPELGPAEDGMPAVTDALGDTLSYSSAQAAVDALVTSLTRPDGCDVDPTADVETLGVTPTSAIYRIEHRFGCDDSGGGFDLEISITSAAPDAWTITTATLRIYCLRGVTDDGLCI